MISRLAHVALRVTDLDRAVRFAITISGLREVSRTGGTAYLTANDRHHELVLVQDDEAGLDHVGLEVASAEDLGRLHDRLVHEGIAVQTDGFETEGVEDALRFVAPSGHAFEVVRGSAHDQPPEYDTAGVRPLRLGHVTLNADDVRASERFLTEVLGFRVSDRMETTMSWLRCSPAHHSVAFVRNPAGLHHYAWDYAGWEDFKRLGDHLVRHGRELVWGPGRHTVGNSLFSYHLDEDGAVVESGAEMHVVDDEAAYAFGEWPDEPRSIVKWGPPPPEGFLDLGMPARSY